MGKPVELDSLWTKGSTITLADNKGKHEICDSKNNTPSGTTKHDAVL